MEEKEKETTFELGTLYDVNKNIVQTSEKELSQGVINSKKEEIKNFLEKTNNEYYMLLCHEKRDYTLFDLGYETYYAYKEKCTDRKQTIVFATSIEHSNDLANEFKNNGIKAMSIDSTLDKKEREKVFNKFKNGEINVITNVGICTTGLDIPSIDSLILARPTKSKSLFVQMVGRSLRLSPETYKEDALIIDIADNTNRHSLINCKTIFDIENGETPIEAEQRRTKEILGAALPDRPECGTSDSRHCWRMPWRARSGSRSGHGSVDSVYLEERPRV